MRNEPDDDQDDDRDEGTGLLAALRKLPIWAWAVAGGGVGLALVAAWFAGKATFAQQKAATAPAGPTAIVLPASSAGPAEVDPDADLKKSATDLDAYTKALANRIPYDIDDFTKGGMKAASYVKDERYNHFLEVVVRVEPVYLVDKITGQSAKYTQAKLTRNNPRPGTYRPGGSGPMRMAETFEWAKVEMLP